MRKLFRVLICIVVICALVVNLSPIRAKASLTVTAAATVAVAGSLVIGAAMIALGAQPGVDTAAWSQKLDEVQSVISNAGVYWKNGCIELFRLTYEAGQAMYYSRAEFLESVRCAMIDTGTIIPPFASFSAGESMTMLDGTVLVPSAECISFIVSYSNASRVSEIFYLPNGGEIYDETNACYQATTYASIDGVRHYFYSLGYSGAGIEQLAQYAGVVWPDHSSSNLTKDVISAYLAGTLDIAVADGLVAGVIPAVPIDGSSALQWSEEYGSRQLRLLTPSGDGDSGGDSGDDSGDDSQGGFVENVLFPLTLLGSIVETAGLTQQNQWSGDVPSNVPDAEVVTEYEILDAPEVDGFQGIQVSPVTNPAPDSGSGTDPEGGTSSGGDVSYTFDLTEYFPFCIPFDIYEFLSLLSADPEAPVFEWVIPVPQMDAEFPMKVDLSAWDGIAKLFRTLELLAFIVGLAMVTRDKFIRG